MRVRTTSARRVIACGLVVGVAVVVSASACSFNTASKKPSGARSITDGETFGKIEHLPGGTAVATNVITLLGVTCVNGQVIVTTNLQKITGKMDCAQQVPQAALDRFFGQSVSITYTGGRLRIESVSAGTIDLPLSGAGVEDVNATP